MANNRQKKRAKDSGLSVAQVRKKGIGRDRSDEEIKEAKAKKLE